MAARQKGMLVMFLFFQDKWQEREAKNQLSVLNNT
jgi:hypothetical protein